MAGLFPYDNIVVGFLILVVGFLFHWVGQLISVCNWEWATKSGLQEAGMSEEYKAYENGIAKADVAIGWIYGVVAIGLFLDQHWSYVLLWVPGPVLVYHAISYWFWTGNRRKNGDDLVSNATRVVWVSMNLISGSLAIVIALYAS